MHCGPVSCIHTVLILSFRLSCRHILDALVQKGPSTVLPHQHQSHWCRVPPYELTFTDRAPLERIVVLLYDKTSNCLHVNGTRRHLFSQIGQQIDNISNHCSIQYRRAIHQGSYGARQLKTNFFSHSSDWCWWFVAIYRELQKHSHCAEYFYKKASRQN